LDEACNRAFAALFPASFAFPIVNGKGMLEVTESTVCLGMVAQRGTACTDGIMKRLANVDCKFLSLFCRLSGRRRQGACNTFRTEAAAPQRFAHIDVSEPGDKFLVQERCLER